MVGPGCVGRAGAVCRAGAVSGPPGYREQVRGQPSHSEDEGSKYEKQQLSRRRVHSRWPSGPSIRRNVDADVSGAYRASSTSAASATPAPSASGVPPWRPAHHSEFSSASVAAAHSVLRPNLLSGAYARTNWAA